MIHDALAEDPRIRVTPVSGSFSLSLVDPQGRVMRTGRGEMLLGPSDPRGSLVAVGHTSVALLLVQAPGAAPVRLEDRAGQHALPDGVR